MIYGIANKNTVSLSESANTKNSIYPAESFKIFRKFATRRAARSFKQTLKNPQHYAIINTRSALVVR